MDNVYRRRFCPTPHSSDKSSNTTVFVVCPVPIRLDPFPGYCALSSIVCRIDTTATALYGTVVHNTTRAPHNVCEHLRCNLTLDIRRRHVVSSQWCPLMMSDEVTGSNTGVLQLLPMVLDLQQESGRPLPLLVNMKIHDQICKFLYSPSYVPPPPLQGPPQGDRHFHVFLVNARHCLLLLGQCNTPRACHANRACATIQSVSFSYPENLYRSFGSSITFVYPPYCAPRHLLGRGSSTTLSAV